MVSDLTLNENATFHKSVSTKYTKAFQVNFLGNMIASLFLAASNIDTSVVVSPLSNIAVVLNLWIMSPLGVE